MVLQVRISTCFNHLHYLWIGIFATSMCYLQKSLFHYIGRLSHGSFWNVLLNNLKAMCAASLSSLFSKIPIFTCFLKIYDFIQNIMKHSIWNTTNFTLIDASVLSHILSKVYVKRLTWILLWLMLQFYLIFFQKCMYCKETYLCTMHIFKAAKVRNEYF